MHPRGLKLIPNSPFPLTLSQSASRFLKVHESIIRMWQEIATSMLRFEVYVKVFDSVPMVESALVSVFVEYIRFCSQTLRFLKRRPLRKS
jgi:hypothetical protein